MRAAACTWAPRGVVWTYEDRVLKSSVVTGGPLPLLERRAAKTSYQGGGGPLQAADDEDDLRRQQQGLVKDGLRRQQQGLAEDGLRRQQQGLAEDGLRREQQGLAEDGLQRGKPVGPLDRVGRWARWPLDSVEVLHVGGPHVAWYGPT